MNCSFVECKKVFKNLDKYDYSSIKNQLDKCENCVFGKNVEPVRSKTYEKIRLLYTRDYWYNK